MRPDDSQDDDAIPAEDEWCPECGGDDVIVLDNGELYCRECRAVIDY